MCLRLIIGTLFLLLAAAGSLPAQPPPETPPPAPAGPQTPSPDMPGRPSQGILPGDTIRVTFEEAEIDGSFIRARNCTVVAGEYTLTGGLVVGDMEDELTFTGNPTLTYRGQTVVGDTIRFSPKAKAYRVENLSGVLSPEFLRGRLQRPLHLFGGSLFGERQPPIFGEDIQATTCERLHPHYYVRAGEIRVTPGKHAVLKRATIVLWGVHLITLPTLVIPLDQRPRRTGYLPRVGRSEEEGWFVKSAFNYLLSDRAPGLFRFDLMEKKGVGMGMDQDWSLLKAAGLLVLYAIPTGGPNKNLIARLNNRLNLGGGQQLSLDNDFQQNSYLALPETTNLNTRVGFNRQADGITTTIGLARQATDSAGSKSRSYTANVAQGFTLGRTGSLNFSADYSRYSSASTGFSQTSESLSARLQADQRAPNYTLQLVANRNVPIGAGTGQSFFGGLERLPELTLSNYRFTRGFLSQIPASFTLGIGRFSEGGTSFGGTGQGTLEERLYAGFDVSGLRYALSPSTDLSVSFGFQQYFYSGGAAQYIVNNTTTLTQRWNRRSGLNLSYNYQRPEGGTPFRFDQLGQSHTLNADIGFLDNRRMQLTARVGYDFGQASFGGFRQPWQTLSINLLLRPLPWTRFQNLFTFDPNTGRFLAVTSELRFRGPNEFALDIASRFDPQRHKFGNINAFLNLPIGRAWRIVGLAQYNGYLNRFESRSLQITRDLHCLEAVLTYIDNPFSFRQDRQLFFEIRIKGLPSLQRFGIGGFGQALDTGVGGVF